MGVRWRDTLTPEQQKLHDQYGIDAGVHIDVETLEFSREHSATIDKVFDTYGREVARVLKKLASDWRERNPK